MANPGRLVDLLDEFVLTFEHWSYEHRHGDNDDADRHLRRLQELLPLVVTIGERHAARVLSSVRADIENEHDPSWWQARAVALAARGDIMLGAEIREALGVDDDNPRLLAEALHPVVWGAASQFWTSHARRQAVHTAASAVNAMLQNKVSRRNVTDADLVAQAFSADPPELGARRLRMPPHDGSPTQRSRQTGALLFGQGCFKALRNPHAHEYVETELDEQIALEQLAAFSVLARWIDQADIDAHRDEGPFSDPKPPPYD